MTSNLKRRLVTYIPYFRIYFTPKHANVTMLDNNVSLSNQIVGNSLKINVPWCI